MADNSDRFLPLRVILTWVLGGIATALVATVFAAQAGTCRPMFAIVLWAAALTAAGLVVGFLFGIPRVLSGMQPRPIENGRPEDARDARDTGHTYQLGPNTNLEEVSDWLTKILVGVGLVQLGTASAHIHNLATTVAESLGPLTPANESIGTGLIVFFSTAGFVVGYIVTRGYLPEVLSNAEGPRAIAEIRAEVGAVDVRVAEAKDQAQDVSMQVLALLKSQLAGQGKIPPGVAQAPAVAGLSAEGEDAEGYYERLWKSDPNKGFANGQNEANGRRLTAVIRSFDDEESACAIHLEVASTDAQRPLVTPVRFLLHPTFDQTSLIRPSIAGVATCDILSWGAFTVGAETDVGDTKLELDLSTIRGGPPAFYNQ